MGLFAKNVIMTAGTRCLQLVCGIGTSMLIARSLGPEGRGIYAMAILLPAMLVAFMDLALGPASVYFIGNSKYKAGEIFGTNLLLGGIISLVSLSLGLLLIFVFGNELFPNIHKKYLLMALIRVPFDLYTGYSLYVLLGLQKIRIYNLFSLLSPFLFLLLLFYFLTSGSIGVSEAIVAYVLSSTVISVTVMLKTIREVSEITVRFRLEIIRDLLSYGIRAYASTVLSFLQYRINFLLVNKFMDPTNVGIYSIAVSSSEQTWVVADSAATVLFPRVASEKDGAKRNAFTATVCRNVIAVTACMVLLLEMIGGWIIITLYSSEFTDSVMPFRILLLGVISISGWRILANDIAGRGKPIINTYITSGVVILTILLNCILIPLDGLRGAAIATIVTYTAAFFGCAIVYMRITNCRMRDVGLIRREDIQMYRRIALSLFQRLLTAVQRTT